MIGSMASVQLPFESGPGAVQGVDLADPLHDRLLEEFGIQVAITPWPQRPAGLAWRRLVRVSAARTTRSTTTSGSPGPCPS
jgi:hypothetical protein